MKNSIQKSTQWTLASLMLMLLLAAPAAAQQGTLVGFAYDAGTGNPLPQVEVEIAGPATFNVKTDTDGGYMIDVPAGSYTVTYRSTKHLPSKVEGVQVIEGEVVDGSAVLSSETEAVQVDVVATVAPEVATASSLLTERKNAETVQDSISGEEIKQGTASDAAGALEKVTGVSVVGDRYVYVRGLGERYSSTSLNNSMLATTEPERRVVPLDLFPANLIDNIKVMKTYAPDLSGEFSGGLVQIETTEFPTKPTMSASYSLGFNDVTQGETFLGYPGGDRDFFGFDDGTRALPDLIPNNERVDRFNFSRDELQDYGRSFNDTWDLERMRDFWRPSQTFNIVAGNTYGKLGLVGAVTFANNVSSLPNQERNFYRPNPDVANGIADPDSVPPIASSFYDYSSSTEAVRLGGIFNASYRFNETNKINFRNFLSRDSDNEARIYQGFYDDASANARDIRLRWVERQLFSTQIEGEHLFVGLGNSILTWQYSYSTSNRDEPDLRENIYIEGSDGFEYFSDSQSAFRMFNDLKENIHNPRVDWMTPFFVKGVTGSIKAGVNMAYRDRDFMSRRFRFVQRGSTDIDRSAPPNELLSDDNIRPNGFELNETTRITDAYDGERDVFGYYGMLDLKIRGKWRFIGGLRVEDVDQSVTTFNPFAPDQNREASPFDATNVLPSINVTYELAPKHNIRAGYSQTVSRPDFRELALFDFTDITGGVTVIGNPDLEQTSIRNYDVRWEYFPGGNQLIAASFFFKQFQDPIERTLQLRTDLISSYANADSAQNFGFELEFRRELSFLAPELRGLALSSNFTFVDSNIDLSNIQNNVVTTLERPLQGQSRYVANFAVEYAKPEWRSTFRSFTNYFSRRITAVGALGLPDVYEEPVTTINFIYELALMDEGRWKLRFSADNLTNPERPWTQGGLIYQNWRTGRTYKIGTSYQIF